MDRLGHKQFHILSHDRGARVAHRLGLDHPDVVKAITILDIAPTREMYAGTVMGFARCLLALVLFNPACAAARINHWPEPR